MPVDRIREIAAKNNEPEAFQVLSDREPGVSWFQQLFAIDLRALAVLRILLAGICIGFVFVQFSYIEVLYTDDGILPRPINQQMLGDGFWSLMWFNDTEGFARTILIFTSLAACVFALGFQTKIMNFALLVLVWSIQVRNPLVLTGGDILLRMLLFWTLFLPLNGTWSFDSVRGGEDREKGWKVASIGSAAIMLQLVYMYFFTGLAKLNPFWLNGDAMEYAMQLEMSVKPLGEWLAGMPGLMKFATVATLVAEISTLFLIFVPRMHHFNRGMLLGFFLMFHIGIWLTMSIGIFSITAIAAWVIFIPSDIWNMWLGTPVGYSEKRFHKPEFLTLDRVLQIVAAVFLVSVTLQNLVMALGPETSRKLAIVELFGRSTMTVQQFHMFSKPPLYSPWFEYNAQLDSGERVDVFDSKRRNTNLKPPSIYTYMQSQNWRRIHWNLITHPLYPPESESVYTAVRERLLQAAVDRWNQEHLADPVIKAELLCHLEPIKLDRIESEQPQFENHDTPHDVVWAAYNKDKSEE